MILYTIPTYRVRELAERAESIKRNWPRVVPVYFNGHAFSMRGEDWGLIGVYTWGGEWTIETLLAQLEEDFSEWVACNPPMSSTKRRYTNR